jgi:hypothetical protein
VPAGLSTGDSYTMDVVLPSTPASDNLTGLAFGSVTLPQLQGVPDEVAAVATDWIGDHAAGGGAPSAAQLGDILSTLRNGAFSDGEIDSGVPSPAGHGAKRLRDFLSGAQLVGDDEQYAATLALMARELGMPARVVLGAIPPTENFDGRVTGAMVKAWVEVDFAGVGWVPLDPTPPVANKPQAIVKQPQANPNGQVLEPPVAQAKPPRPLPPPQAEEPVEGDGCLFSFFCFNALPEWAQWTLRYLAPPVLSVGAVLLAIVGAKAIRRRRRRRRGPPVQRISGAWLELVDRLRDHGYPATPFDTRQDIATRVAGTDRDDDDTAVVRLATLADAAVFGPGNPDDAMARQVWQLVPQAIREVSTDRSRWQRFLARINPLSLRPDARTVAALAAAARERASRRRRRPPTASPATT